MMWQETRTEWTLTPATDDDIGLGEALHNEEPRGADK
jgi:hypothetical protein